MYDYETCTITIKSELMLLRSGKKKMLQIIFGSQYEQVIITVSDNKKNSENWKNY